MSETIKNNQTCNDCGATFNADNEGISTSEGLLICDSCRDNYSYCEENDEYYPNDEILSAYKMNSRGVKIEISIHESLVENGNYAKTEDGEFWHKDDVLDAHSSRGRSIIISREDYENGDYYTCDDCGEIFHCDHRIWMENLERDVCNGCYENSYSYCSDCDEYHDCGDSCSCGGNEENSSKINDYNFKPTPKFRGRLSPNDPFIGFELEIENKNGTISSLVEACNEVFPDGENTIYLKKDGSLNNGFEIVSHPMTIEEHKKNSYETLVKRLSSEGAKSHDTKTCGLHFHLDKRKMTDAHKIRFGAFFALSKNKLEILARRSCPDYAQFKDKKTPMKDFSRSSSRYEAVNWENQNTVEVRIFKGTLKFETFMASMELCHAVFVFTKGRHSFSCKFEENEIWGRFMKFLKAQKNYPNLKAYLETKAVAIRATMKLDDLERQKIELEEKIEAENRNIHVLTSSMENSELETA